MKEFSRMPKSHCNFYMGMKRRRSGKESLRVNSRGIRHGSSRPDYLVRIYLRASVVPYCLLRRENQERVSGSARSKHVTGADKHHAAGDGGAGSGHRAAFGWDMINCFIIANHVVLPQ